jgi:CDP-glucose 4,6-dehydratase
VEKVVSQPVFDTAYRGRRVFVTGHTGFKGSWLCEWLLDLGAEVAGFALEPDTEPTLFKQLGLAARMSHQIADVRDAEAMRAAIQDFQPDYVFHLAAQPLVRRSYMEPLETFAANVMGTAHVCNALRSLEKPCAAVMITTDKVYENLEVGRAFREDDKLGGHDPYSASKAAAEIVIESWRKSFFSAPDSRIALASARAGNVIGGGDWAADRIVPDCMRALQRGEPVRVRNPRATRPWQHVLEPLGGYLLLGARLLAEPENAALRTAFNFGPSLDADRTVGELVTEVLRNWPGEWEHRGEENAPHEAGLLHLDITKARDVLGWRPRWDFPTTIRETVEWYRAAQSDPDAVRELTRRQISDYIAAP